MTSSEFNFNFSPRREDQLYRELANGEDLERTMLSQFSSLKVGLTTPAGVFEAIAFPRLPALAFMSCFYPLKDTTAPKDLYLHRKNNGAIIFSLHLAPDEVLVGSLSLSRNGRFNVKSLYREKGLGDNVEATPLPGRLFRRSIVKSIIDCSRSGLETY